MAPSWTVPVDEATGFVVGSPLWNQLLGASGDLMVLAAVAQDATLVDIVSSVTETDLIGVAATGVSIPGGTLQSASKLRITLLADLLNNTGGVHGGTIKLYWGGNGIAAELLGISSGANRHTVTAELFIVQEAATNLAGMMGVVAGYPGAGTAAVPALLPTPNVTRGWSDFTVDGTVAQNLRVTWTPDLNSASLEFRKRNIAVEKVGNA